MAVGAGEELVVVEVPEVGVELAPGPEHRPAGTTSEHLHSFCQVSRCADCS